MMYWSKDHDDDVLIKWSVCDDDDVHIKRSEYDDDDAVRELKYDYGADHDVTDQVADWKNKMMKVLLLIERSKRWRCCWSKGQSTEDVVEGVSNQKVKVLRCCWSKGQKMLMLIKELLSLKIEDGDYMMLKSFQWFIYVLPWWCWWCPLLLLLLMMLL